MNETLKNLLSKHGKNNPKLNGFEKWMPFLSAEFSLSVSHWLEALLEKEDKIPGIRAKEGDILLSILDLHTVDLFAEYTEFLEDRSLALLVTEIVFFEAAECAMEEPSWEDLDNGRGRKYRGIFKYLRARGRWKDVDDPVPVVFGSEWSDILSGNPMDTDRIIIGAQLCNEIRKSFRSKLRAMLYGAP